MKNEVKYTRSGKMYLIMKNGLQNGEEVIMFGKGIEDNLKLHKDIMFEKQVLKVIKKYFTNTINKDDNNNNKGE